MDEYPDSEEEFELMYDDELEALREHEDEVEKSNVNVRLGVSKSRKSLDFVGSRGGVEVTAAGPSGVQKSFEEDFPPLTNEEIGEPSKKRTIEELFGDIDDILYDRQTKSKKHKGSEHASEYALIDHILELRQQSKTQNLLQHHRSSSPTHNPHNLSHSVPKWPFMPCTDLQGRTVYIRFHSEAFMKEANVSLTQDLTQISLFSDSSALWAEAQSLLNAPVAPPELEPIHQEKDLWVDLYKPRKYYELLSDESTNRIILKWLKLWDKVVFKKPVLKKINLPQKKFELNSELDENGRPQYKVALLCGPPGLGKTTLAHMVATHAGYNVIEVNASDDRSVDSFRTSLENATQMTSVLDKAKRPNCLIFDEIDGAPQTSIDYLVKFIGGGAKTKKGKKSSGSVLKRPIICICNDAFAPALRPLRQMAFVVNFPQTSEQRLAQRLMEIARKQHIKTDLGAMLALAKKSNNDIRSCLSVLHFFKSKKVTLSDIYRASIGQKDIQKNLFSVWNDLFFIQRTQIKTGNREEDAQLSAFDGSLKGRMKKVLDVVNSYGDYDRVAQGVFENFPMVHLKNASMESVSQAADWFCHNDTINKQIYSNQNYSLSGYLQYAFVVWHFTFAARVWQKLQYPSAGYEARTKHFRQRTMINEMMRGMQPNIRAFHQRNTLIQDVIPLLSTILVPILRPINLNLLSEEENRSLKRVVNAMIDYNLNYVQERNPDGTYQFNLDPDVYSLVTFQKRPSLSYSNRQIVAKQIEVEKMLRLEVGVSRPQPAIARSAPLMAKPRRDFFGRIIPPPATPEPGANRGTHLKSDIWYQYKEGYNNAVRKKITIHSLK